VASSIITASGNTLFCWPSDSLPPPDPLTPPAPVLRYHIHKHSLLQPDPNGPHLASGANPNGELRTTQPGPREASGAELPRLCLRVGQRGHLSLVSLEFLLKVQLRSMTTEIDLPLDRMTLLWCMNQVI
jgi:hypothetical protein